VAVFANDGGSLTLLAIEYTAQTIAPGASAEGMVIALQTGDLGSDGLTARVDELGAGFGLVEECDETNNAGTWQGVCQ
jgi:hypothetical protein